MIARNLWELLCCRKISPNPENFDALSEAITLAKNNKVDLIFGTDPDSDRMGVGVADGDGEIQLLNGNIIGALLADYRINKLKELGVEDALINHKGLTLGMLVTLGEKKIKSLKDFAELSTNKLND